jgi:hypothetical protein
LYVSSKPLFLFVILADDNPYLSESDDGEPSSSAAKTSSAVSSHLCHKKQVVYSAGTQKFDGQSNTSSAADLTEVLDVSNDVGTMQRQNDAVAVLASKQSSRNLQQIFRMTDVPVCSMYSAWNTDILIF